MRVPTFPGIHRSTRRHEIRVSMKIISSIARTRRVTAKRSFIRNNEAMTVIKRERERESPGKIFYELSGKNRDGGNSDRLEILPCVFIGVRLLRSASASISARWQSHDNQRRIVIGNPISLPNCTPNRFAGANGNFLHVPCVICFHVPELNTRDRACVATLSRCLLRDSRKFRRLSAISLIRIQHLTLKVWFSSTSYTYRAQ